MKQDVAVKALHNTNYERCEDLSLTMSASFLSPRSLGVVIWELFEFGSQPHRHLSDEEVLTFVIRERQITLAQPRLKLSHADYWSVPIHD